MRWLPFKMDASCCCTAVHGSQGSGHAVGCIMTQISSQCRLTALTSLCINLTLTLPSRLQLDLSIISQLQQLRELRVEKYSDLYGGLAQLPLSLTSLDLVYTNWNHRRNTTEVAFRGLANLQQFKISGDSYEWKHLLQPLARIPGLLDLQFLCKDRGDLSLFSTLSAFVHLTRLSLSCRTDDVHAGLGHISYLSELRELHSVGIWKEQRDSNHPEMALFLSRLSLLTSLTLTGFWAKGASWLICPALLAGVQILGLQRCRFPAALWSWEHSALPS